MSLANDSPEEDPRYRSAAASSESSLSSSARLSVRGAETRALPGEIGKGSKFETGFASHGRGGE